MITGVGLDVCEISRMEKLLEREGFVRRFFTMEEEKYIRTRGKGAAGTLAGLFAAREAFPCFFGSGLSCPSFCCKIGLLLIWKGRFDS